MNNFEKEKEKALEIDSTITVWEVDFKNGKWVVCPDYRKDKNGIIKKSK
jgi:hypothetical protein